MCKDFIYKYKRQEDYLNGGFFNQEQIYEINNLVTKSTKLLICLLEGKTNTEILEMMS